MPKGKNTMTQEHKDKISKSKIGIKHTQDTKDRISATKTGMCGLSGRVLFCNENGKTYNSLREAAEDIHVSYGSLKQLWKKGIAGYTFRRVN